VSLSFKVAGPHGGLRTFQEPQNMGVSSSSLYQDRAAISEIGREYFSKWKIVVHRGVRAWPHQLNRKAPLD